MKIVLVKQLNGSFLPAYNSDYELAKKIKFGELREFETKRPRNLDFHKKCFALFNLVFENQDDFSNFDHLRKYLTMKAGYYTKINTPTGVIYEADSLSFASMNQDTFDKYYSDLLDVVTKLYGMERQDILDNLQEFY
jgi:hypothetical protein